MKISISHRINGCQQDFLSVVLTIRRAAVHMQESEAGNYELFSVNAPSECRRTRREVNPVRTNGC